MSDGSERLAASAPTRPKLRSRRTTAPGITPATRSNCKRCSTAAGIEGLDPSTEAAQTLGEILRVAVGGVMESLRMRRAHEGRPADAGTTFKAAAQQSAQVLRQRRRRLSQPAGEDNPAYLAPWTRSKRRFTTAGSSGRVPAAMRLAFESMLSQFDPQRLQEEFDRQMKGSILGVPAKLRYWDLYRDKYGDLIKDAEAAFRTLFGEAFARAYEEHLERLKQPGRSAGQRHSWKTPWSKKTFTPSTFRRAAQRRSPAAHQSRRFRRAQRRRRWTWPMAWAVIATAMSPAAWCASRCKA